MISDHYHPWTNSQKRSPFVWSVLGGIAGATSRIPVGTGVTCPTMRIHPAIIAQAAATAAAMMPGRFVLGVGSGENLNEHIIGAHWPRPKIRLEMLQEAIGVLRLLWRGGWRSHHGKHYRVEAARVFTLPDQPPQIMVAASQRHAAELAARVGDGLINVQPDAEVVRTFEQAGGSGKPRYGSLAVCWAQDKDSARETVVKMWRNAAVSGGLMTDRRCRITLSRPQNRSRPSRSSRVSPSARTRLRT
jgi:coenzyme F420-dependent glucose-6-phosphate dehydrogenase